ncbi:MAG: chemotaxis protein CheW [Treponema sp.]|nr:chemotaxis protein CheW [Treponema sp.]
MSDFAEITEIIDEEPEDINTEKYLIFSILDKLYSFPSRIISEIAIFDTVYPLPLLPPFVLGVVNRYSIPHALFDIGLLFHKTASPRKKIIIIKEEIDHIAFLIDDVSGIADIHTENIYIIDRDSQSGDLSDAVCASFKWNENDVFVLDVHRIIGRISQEAV